METTVWINDTQINAYNFKEETANDANSRQQKRKISFDFKVTSEEYHDVAVLLYKMNFRIRVPEQDLEFDASISNYSTSITDLYKPGQVADYYLELIEQV
ncbi:DUF3219 family protein [Microbacterium sp. APC 3898]|uniref:DUF3219 family protein n=1 Tax=Planococcus notacanthi TaxID=3035188 RepID=A0ABT7ZLP6_9BACL|nr:MULTISPECIES: DUF3219 family protein [Terrabacteria group]MDN3428069.1 DUF3219 family protein [Planococcus sp. APC 4016]MDN3498396.1 DUF3219 family protein [Microbacterium sp. APC 3898]